MCVGELGEARKGAVCKNELSCPNYSHNEAWAFGAWSWVLRMVATILSPLVLTAHSHVGGRFVLGHFGPAHGTHVLSET